MTQTQTQTQEDTILDDLNLIQNIKNETPWDTGDLAAFLIPRIRRLREAGTEINKVLVKTKGTTPGAKKEKQRLVSAKMDWQNATLLEVQILSPRRAADRTDLLDRLSLADDLKPNEARMPPIILARLDHALRRANSNQYYGCRMGRCDCKLRPIDDVIIRGCKKAKTRTPKTLEQVERSLSRAERNVVRQQEKLDDAVRKRDRLLKRVEKLRKKERDGSSRKT